MDGAKRAEGNAPQRARRPPSALKRLWQRIRLPLKQSRLAKRVLVEGVYGFFRFVRLTNRVRGAADLDRLAEIHSPCIVALWHGQHLLAPFYKPGGVEAVALVSRSADAELNAMILDRLGVGVVRGSGGRDRAQSVAKGGGAALIALKRALAQGKNVFMIADIPHGVPRASGQGVVKLAQISGRPILPFAVATSRRKVIERSWDGTTINLPFGRAAIVAGDIVSVPADLDEAGIEAFRAKVEESLNAATARAYTLVDGAT